MEQAAFSNHSYLLIILSQFVLCIIFEDACLFVSASSGKVILVFYTHLQTFNLLVIMLVL